MQLWRQGFRTLRDGRSFDPNTGPFDPSKGLESGAVGLEDCGS